MSQIGHFKVGGGGGRCPLGYMSSGIYVLWGKFQGVNVQGGGGRGEVSGCTCLGGSVLSPLV